MTTGFHVAPHPTSDQAKEQTKTIDEIYNLGTATTAYRTAVANLTIMNAELTKELDYITEKIVTSMTKVASTAQQLSDC